MLKGFDIVAPAYDASFTHSPIGNLQRKAVHNILEPYLKPGKSLNILELNCGTGEDAVFMARYGHKVLATDLSEEMLAQARSKALESPEIEFKQLDITELETHLDEDKFDLLFSNFGGLNCLSEEELQDFFSAAFQKLTADGFLILVIMPTKCLWDRCYGLLKGRIKKAFRRSAQGPLLVEVGGEKIPTWYYDPNQLKALSANNFKEVLVKPIGFAIPPSYMNSFFRNKKKLLNFLAWMDRRLFSFSALAAYSDHYIHVFKKK